MRRRAAISLIAACAISACAHQTSPAVSGVEGMRWIEVEGDDPKLAFGLPDSDVLVIMMTCAPKSGEVQIAVFGDTGGRRPVMQIRSGASSARLPVSTTPSELHDAVVEAETKAATPVLASFARTGELAVGVGASPMALPPADPAKAQRFVDRCR